VGQPTDLNPAEADEPQRKKTPLEERLEQMRAEQALPPGPHFHMAEFVKIGSIGSVFGFMTLSMQTYKHARMADGYLAGGIRSKWWRKEFWTYSVWRDEEAMRRFSRTGYHERLAAKVEELATPGSRYAKWVSEQPPDWPDALGRLERTTTYIVPPF
jgi:hypothetical protein